MSIQLQNNMNSGNSYQQLFHKALDNYSQVCEEFQATGLCKNNRRRHNNKTQKLIN
jgi:hypothetical protein